MKILPKPHLAPWYTELSATAELHAPCFGPDGTVLYGRITPQMPAAQIATEVARDATGPKTVLLPHYERLFAFDASGPLPDQAPQPAKGKLILAGVRGGDLAGLSFLDRFFSRQFADEPYFSRRRRGLLLAWGASRPPEGAFRTAQHQRVFAESGFDLQLVDLGEEFLVESGSPAGEALLVAGGGRFRPASAPALSRAAEVKRAADTALDGSVPVDQASALAVAGQIPQKFWEWVSEHCLACGGCSYVCPSCTCFQVFDWAPGSDSPPGERWRCGDSCLYAGFTREASGFNPRPTPGARVCRWYEHKLRWDVKSFGHHTCYGCGRCSTVCPGMIGMRRVATEIVTRYG